MENIYLDQIPSDIIRIIHSGLKTPGQLNLILTSKIFKKYPITDLSVTKYCVINDNQLKIRPYIIKLNIRDNYKIVNISHLVNLQVLYISGKKL